LIDRRNFIKTIGAAGGALILNPFRNLNAYHTKASEYFGIHPFIEDNPDAVFIMRTDVNVKTNSQAIKQIGMHFGKSVFVHLADELHDIPLTNNVVIKPNLTSRGKWDSRYTVEGSVGVVTDACFVEGIIERFKELEIPASQIYLREVNGTENMTEGGYGDVAERTGADIQIINTVVDDIPEDDLQWIDVPDGIWFNKIPYLWPVNSPDSWLLNISKFKTHAMGMTLCAKNLQGSIAANYQQHCSQYEREMNISYDHVNSDAKTVIMENYNRHVSDGIPRWDRPQGSNNDGGLWMETWATRCLDNNSVTKPGLHIIEGIYGRDGHFIAGPNDGLANDYMTNILIFGKNQFLVDIIGHWLGGHEPGNFGLFHLAKERGFISQIDPLNIPIYEWKTDGSAPETKLLTEFERIPLKTNYLRRDYNYQNEDYWHICDEPYDYSTDIDRSVVSRKPGSFRLMQNYPNPFNDKTTIKFLLPRSGFTHLDLYNARGEIVDVLVNRYCDSGVHQVIWQANQHSTGIYFYRLRLDDFIETKKLIYAK